MSRLLAGAAAGALAGAAGATALNATSYLDMVLRGRPAGSSPKATVDAASDAAGTDVPGERDQAQNRASGAGELAGIGVGLGVGAVAGILRAFHVKIPMVLAPVVTGLGAMAISDSAMTALGVTDPRSWDAGTVASDALPHLAYGTVLTVALHLMLDPRTPHAS